MKDQELDNLFSENLKDQEVSPPEFVWHNIASKLDEEKIIPIKKKKNLIFWSIAATTLIALGICLKIFLFQEGHNISESIVNKGNVENNIEPKKQVIVARTNPIVKSEITDEINKDVKTTKVVQQSIATKGFGKPKNISNPSTVKNEVKTNELMVTPTQEMTLVSSIDLDEIENKVELSATEVAPIQPLVNIIEKEEIMYAETKPVESKKKQTIFTNILNTITDNFNPSSKSIKFSSDEEGTLKVDLYNSIAKTRR